MKKVPEKKNCKTPTGLTALYRIQKQFYHVKQIVTTELGEPSKEPEVSVPAGLTELWWASMPALILPKVKYSHPGNQLVTQK